MKCSVCKTVKASLKRPKTGKLTCIECFKQSFEDEIHLTIQENNLFKEGETIAIGISGGKDSTVLAYIINKLNNKYNYKLNLQLIAIDEGISGYRDYSIETIKENSKELNLPLTLLSFKDLFKYTMDEIVPLIGIQNSCTYCGIFRRQALEKGASMVKANKIITGHNADDIAETVLMNLLRGDYNRLPTSCDIITGGNIPRVKIFKYVYEKEIVMYAHYNKLKYFCNECTYSVASYRGYLRNLVKDLESERSTSIIDIIHSGENWEISKNVKGRNNLNCLKCGNSSSNQICKACELIEKLESLSKGKKKEIKYEK